MTTKTEVSYKFIIDTDKYAGNFERELCAHMTGQIGECGVGHKFIPDISELLEEHPLMSSEKVLRLWGEIEDLVECKDEQNDGCMRPCYIYPTEGVSNDGNGKHYKVTNNRPFKYPAYYSVCIFMHKEPSKEVIDFLKTRAGTFGQDVKVLGFRLVKQVNTTETSTWSI